MHQKKKYYTARQMTQMLGVSRQTLHRWRQREDNPLPPPISLFRCMLRWNAEEVDAWLEQLRAEREAEKEKWNKGEV